MQAHARFFHKNMYFLHFSLLPTQFFQISAAVRIFRIFQKKSTFLHFSSLKICILQKYFVSLHQILKKYWP